jgi:hypothetical protein
VSPNNRSLSHNAEPAWSVQDYTDVNWTSERLCRINGW